MKYVKKFIDFMYEGARPHDNYDDTLLSFYPHEDDVLDTSHGASTKKMYKFEVFWGLEISPIEAKTIKVLKGKQKKDYIEVITKFMKTLKGGKFVMDEKDLQTADSKDAIKIDGKSTNINASALFNFIKKNINDLKGESRLKNLKYIIHAESADPGSKIIAEALSYGTGAQIITLQKKEYTSPYDIMKDKYKADYNLNDRKELEKQLEQILATVTYTDKNGDEQYHIDKKGTSRKRLMGMFMKILRGPYKITTVDNHIRQFLNTKYHYDNEFTNAVLECSRKSNNSKMIIVDDNFASGTDMTEIFGVCKHIIDTKEQANTEMMSKYSQIEKERAMNTLKLSNDNIFGFVLYKMAFK
jgi:hypothetical protein